ncbi:TPA: MFS transporter, partial [Escherichia coli]|nr:MFS transporter [Escherichia coli]
TITMMLMVIGLGFSIGNYLGGYFADKNLYPTLLTLFVLSAISMVMFPIIATNIAGATVGLLFWSIVSFALVPPIQILVMNAAVGAQALASSVNIGAFNLGNAIGAAVGAAILSHGYSYTTMSFMGALLAIVGFIVILLIVRRKNSETQTQDVMCSAN